MIKRLKLAAQWRGLGIKRLMLIIVLTAMFMMPEDSLHLLAGVAHTLFESIAFAIEFLLVHGFGLSKFQAQLIVFYTSFATGILGAIVLFRRISQMVASAKTWAIQSYIQIRADLINRWTVFSSRRKIEFIMLQLVAVSSMVALLIS
jgi:hypothetical protein